MIVKLEELVRNPVFQLNLLLWMAKEQPDDGYRVKPLFYRWGYRFIMVESPVGLPPPTVTAAKASGLEISLAPEPEMILGYSRNHRALYFEAKSDSFSSASSTSRQARGHLLVTGPVFKDIITPYKEARLCYVLPEDRRTLMQTCLNELCSQMRTVKLEPGTPTVHGLKADSGSIIYSWDEGFRDYVGATSVSEAILEGAGEETDPSPLLIIYTDEDYSGVEHINFGREAMIKQVWAQLLCELHAHEGGQPFQAKADALLTKTTSDIFNYLGKGRQRSLCRLVKDRLFTRVRDFWKSKETERNDISVSVIGDVLTVELRDELARGNFLDWLEDTDRVKPDYSALSIEQETLPLGFDIDSDQKK